PTALASIRPIRRSRTYGRMARSSDSEDLTVARGALSQYGMCRPFFLHNGGLCPPPCTVGVPVPSVCRANAGIAMKKFLHQFGRRARIPKHGATRDIYGSDRCTAAAGERRLTRGQIEFACVPGHLPGSIRIVAMARSSTLSDESLGLNSV